MKFEKIKDELSIVLFTIMTIVALMMLFSERSTTDFSEYAWFVCSIVTTWAASALWFAYRFGKSYQKNSLAEDNKTDEEPIKLVLSHNFWISYLCLKYDLIPEDEKTQKK